VRSIRRAHAAVVVWGARLEKAELGLDTYGMRKALGEKGLKYVDGPLD
jgi:hypothetical protein